MARRSNFLKNFIIGGIVTAIAFYGWIVLVYFQKLKISELQGILLTWTEITQSILSIVREGLYSIGFSSSCSGFILCVNSTGILAFLILPILGGLIYALVKK